MEQLTAALGTPLVVVGYWEMSFVGPDAFRGKRGESNHFVQKLLRCNKIIFRFWFQSCDFKDHTSHYSYNIYQTHIWVTWVSLAKHLSVINCKSAYHKILKDFFFFFLWIGIQSLLQGCEDKRWVWLLKGIQRLLQILLSSHVHILSLWLMLLDNIFCLLYGIYYVQHILTVLCIYLNFALSTFFWYYPLDPWANHQCLFILDCFP